MKKLVLLIVCFVLSLSFCSCDKDDTDSKPKMNIDAIQMDDGTYQNKYNGNAQEFFIVEEGEAVDVVVTINRVSGTFNCVIGINETTDYIYEGNDLPTSTFTVTAREAGYYRIYIDTCDFVGTYSFKYPL